MKILALDISTKSTGWFVTKRSCDVIAPDPGLSFPEKLAVFRENVVYLVEKYKPDVVVIEDTYLRFNPHTLKQLSQFAGVAMEVCGSRGIKVDTITATQARKHCCGKQEGAFKKREVFKYFAEKYGLEDWTFSEHNDITDAMALSWGYREIQGVKKKGDKKKAGK